MYWFCIITPQVILYLYSIVGSATAYNSYTGVHIATGISRVVHQLSTIQYLYWKSKYIVFVTSSS